MTCGFPEDVVGPRAPVNENQVILLWVACSWPFVELIYHRPAGSACRTANKAAKLLTFLGYIFSRENKVYTFISGSIGKVRSIEESSLFQDLNL